MQVPFVDLKIQYESIKAEVDNAIRHVIENTQFIGGDTVKKFEEDFASYIGSNHCVSCANGTDAIEIALTAVGIGPGDEVLVPAMSWIATSEAVTSVGATPIFVDIHEDFYTIDPPMVSEKISEKTKAIIPVHLYGLPCNMEATGQLASDFNLKVIEDCAQAHGATYKGQKVGTFGDISTFSFYPGKNLGAYGDAGAIVTNDNSLALQCRRISNHGQQGKHNHLMEGRNSRMDTLQAAVLKVKLKRIDEWNRKRRNIAVAYKEHLDSSLIKTPQSPNSANHVYHVFGVQVENREHIMKELAKRGINTQIHYPSALPLMPAYKYFKHKPEDFPVAFQLSQHELSLPMYPEITKEKITYVCDNLNELLY